MSRKILGYGPSQCQLMVIGEWPSLQDEQLGVPFSASPPAITLNQMLTKAGMPLDACYRTMVYKCRPPQDDMTRIKETGITYDQAIEELYQEIHQINPNIILCLGDIALAALCRKSGISHYRGSILQAITRHKVVCSINTTHLYQHVDKGKLRGPMPHSARYYMMGDIKRAVAESYTREMNLPKRKLEIARNASDLIRYLYKYDGKRRCAADIEVFKAIPTCISLALDPLHAISIPLLNLKPSETFPEIADGTFADLWMILAKVIEDPRMLWIMQNGKFDVDKIWKILGMHINKLHSDISIKMQCIYPEYPKALEFTTSVFTREPYYKNELSEFSAGKEPVEQHYTYNARDSAVTIEIDDAMEVELDEMLPKYPWIKDFYYNFMMKMHPLYMELESYGLLVDKEKKKELWEKYDRFSKEAGEVIESIIGEPVNTNSPKQVSNALYNILKFPSREGTGESVITRLLANHAKDSGKRAFCTNLLKKRSYDKTKSTYIEIEADTDNRMRTSYRLSGAETGRTSTSNLNPPLRPFHNVGLPFQVITKHGDIGADVGHIYCADKGYVFVNFDKSQAEPRIVANLSEDFELLKIFEEGRLDVHKIAAGLVFDLEEAIAQAMDKEDPRRFLGKTCRNGCNYDMKKFRYTETVNNDARKYGIPSYDAPLIISEAEGDIQLKKFHKANPKIKGVFHEGIKKALYDNKNILVNPYGRVRRFFDQYGDNLFKEGYAYTPQSTVADSLHHDMLEVKKIKPSLLIVLECHDAFMTLSRIKDYEEDIEICREVMEKPIDFSRCSLPRQPLKIPCGIEIGERYNDFRKYKRVK